MPIIVPTLLNNTFVEFTKQAKECEGIFSQVQIDVMDGKFVDNTSFPERAEINSLNLPFQYELQLMVADPIAEMRTWQNVDNVFRAVVHVETISDPLRAISFIRKEGWEAGLGLIPETPLAKIKDYADRVEVVMFMLVRPGHQGAPVVPEVFDKIKEFTAQRPICKFSGQPVLCAVDGGVNKSNIKQLADIGVDIFNVGSALMKAKNMKQAYEELKKIIS